MPPHLERVRSKVHDLKRRLSKDDSALNNGRFVLITNGSGYVSTWIIRQFLSNGYQVRTTVRSNPEAQDVRDTFSQYAHNLEICGIKGNDFRDVVDRVDGVVVTELEEWRDVLDAIVKEATHVGRVVVTSGLGLSQELESGQVFTETDCKPSAEEKAIHAFIHERRPDFTLATVCPTTVWGPVAHKTDLEGLKTCLEVEQIWKLMEGENSGELRLPAFVDVRNVAQAHLRAYEHQPSSNSDEKQDEEERYIISSDSITKSQLCSTLKEILPERRLKIPKIEDTGEAPYSFDTTKTKETLCMMSLISLEDCLRDMGQSLNEIEEASKKGLRYDGQEWFRHV